jgi:hypothetical protein
MSVPPWLIRDAFKIVFDSFDLNKVKSSDGKVWNVKPVRSMRRVKTLIKYFINTPVRLPSGERFRKQGGVPSGSMFTNIIDSIVNTIVMRYCVYHTTGHFPKAEMYLGDDSFIVTNGITNVEDFASLAEEKFGMTVNREKSYLTTNPNNVQYLGYFNRRSLPYKGHGYLVASFIYPEREVKSNEIRVARAVGQMWSTLHSGMAYKWHVMIQDMLQEYKVRMEDVTEHIRTHPSYFRYLRMLGIPLKEIGLPEMEENGVLSVDPRTVPKRPFRKKTWNIEKLWEQAMLYNWQW